MKISANEIIAELKNGAQKNIILDTDAYNEVDDQYAIAYSMLSGDKVNLLSINAAPFLNSRSVSAGDGMEKSYNEIFHITALTDPEMAKRIPVYRGSERFMTSKSEYVPSDACDNIVRTVMESEERVWIVALGAITNVASAIVKEPAICDRAVVVWLGGHALERPDTREFRWFRYPATECAAPLSRPFPRWIIICAAKTSFVIIFAILPRHIQRILTDGQRLSGM